MGENGGFRARNRQVRLGSDSPSMQNRLASAGGVGGSGGRVGGRRHRSRGRMRPGGTRQVAGVSSGEACVAHTAAQMAGARADG